MIQLSKTLIVGIDVSSETNTVCLMNAQGSTLGKISSFPNNLPGAKSIEEHLDSVMSKNSFDSLEIGTESTSFLDLHLVDFLASSKILAKYSPKVYQLNPKIVKGFKKSYTDKDKTDKSDSFVIADRVRFGRLPKPYQAHQSYLPLRRLTRYRLHLVETICREKNYFLTHLFLKYSGFCQEKPFSNLFGATSLACVIEFFSPEELAGTPMEDLVKFIIEKGKKGFANPEAVAEAVKKAAKDSYQLRPALLSSVNFVLASIYQTLRTLQKALKEVDDAIAKEFRAFPNTLESIPGIGSVYAAGIFSEIGDIRRFQNHAQLAKFAGLTWRKDQSGKFEAEETRLTKSGNEYLRYYLNEAANALRVHNAEYKAYYESKFKEVPKHQHKRAVVLTARKLVRLIFALLAKEQLYRFDR